VRDLRGFGPEGPGGSAYGRAGRRHDDDGEARDSDDRVLVVLCDNQAAPDAKILRVENLGTKSRSIGDDVPGEEERERGMIGQSKRQGRLHLPPYIPGILD